MGVQNFLVGPPFLPVQGLKLGYAGCEGRRSAIGDMTFPVLVPLR